MNNRFKIILIFSLALWLSGCGYSKLNNLEDNKIHLSEITFSGEQRIGYIIKNKLVLGSSPTGENNLKLNLIIDKKKEIKEKNINNEITKYQMNVTTKVNYEDIFQKMSGDFIINVSGDYKVVEKHISTINNEKKLQKNLANEIADIILKELSNKLNDL